MMGAISLCGSFSSSGSSGDMVPSSSSSSTLFNGTTEADPMDGATQDTRTTTATITGTTTAVTAAATGTTTAVTAAATGTTRVAAAALVGAGTTSLVWSGWMQAYASRVGAASATRLKLAEDGEDEAISRLALYGVDFAVTSAGATDLTPVLAAACVDCMSVPMAVRPYAAIYNVPEIARAGVSLLLDANLLAGIFLGRIDVWNHVDIVAANPSLAELLPGRQIIVALAKGGTASGAGGPLGGVANRFAAEYMAADAAFRAEVLNGSATTTGLASIVYPLESSAPARILVAGDHVAAAVKATLYSVGVDAIEAALAARNPSVADLRDANGNRVSPKADALALATADFVLDDFVARSPARRATAYSPMTSSTSSSLPRSSSHAPRANATLPFAGLPTMMVGAATAGAWPILGWHHAYMHRETTPDCAKAAGLVDAFYWTQTSDDGVTVAAAQGLATSARAAGPAAAARIISALADVTCYRARVRPSRYSAWRHVSMCRQTLPTRRWPSPCVPTTASALPARRHRHRQQRQRHGLPLRARVMPAGRAPTAKRSMRIPHQGTTACRPRSSWALPSAWRCRSAVASSFWCCSWPRSWSCVTGARGGAHSTRAARLTPRRSPSCATWAPARRPTYSRARGAARASPSSASTRPPAGGTAPRWPTFPKRSG
ncbi:LysR-type transcriptional regulators binding domain containing protein [Pandoravirus celtis]|uniref:LysR-type transcriptional regulators binding domain containing protein n=1 Tax=Pandoravirus celtis TaxID=2568002 RepID=A0A4D6EHX4_9VIRU|nr:LysR-type transcriptional regulators binding domain containing protein [Pandoravirus celtis]